MDNRAPENDVFAVGEERFTLDVLDAIYRCRDLYAEAAERAKALPEERRDEATARGYLEGVVAWLEQERGVSLTLGQADWLTDQLELLHAKKKRERADAIRDALR